PKTEDTPRFNPQPLQPSPGALGNAADPAKAVEPPKEDGNTITIPSKEKPRTLAAAKQQKNIVGEKVKQEGGVKRRGQIISPDVAATSFGAYDAAFIAAVQKRWFDILDNTSFSQRPGKVVLEFRLKYDGTIVEMRQSQTDVGEVLALICQRAVEDPAPYAAWPRDM